MEYCYLVVKKNDILKFAGKWMELQNKTKKKKKKHPECSNSDPEIKTVCTHSSVDIRHKAKDSQATIHNKWEARIKGGH